MFTNSMNSLDKPLGCDLCAIVKPPDEHIPEAVLNHTWMSTIIGLNNSQLRVRYSEVIANVFPFCDQLA